MNASTQQLVYPVRQSAYSSKANDGAPTRRLPAGLSAFRLRLLRSRYLEAMRDGSIPRSYCREMLDEIGAALGVGREVAA